jgi:hypothetical protein
MASVRLTLAVKNPENDPFGVDLESTLATSSHQSLVFSFPLLETFSLELVGFATLLRVSAAPKEGRKDLAWSCSTRALFVESLPQWI